MNIQELNYIETIENANEVDGGNFFLGIISNSGLAVADAAAVGPSSYTFSSAKFDAVFGHGSQSKSIAGGVAGVGFVGGFSPIVAQ